MNLKMSNLARVLALVLFGLLASACNMNVQEFLEARQGSSAGGMLWSPARARNSSIPTRTGDRPVGGMRLS